MPRTCARCRSTIGGRADRRFCSTACRVAANRARRRHAEPRLSPADLERLVDAVGSERAETALVEGLARAAADDWLAPREEMA